MARRKRTPPGEERKTFCNEKLLIKRYEDPNESKNLQPLNDINRDVGYLKPGDNAFMVMKLYELLTWGDPDYNDVDELEDRFFRYLWWCGKNDFKVSNQVCYMALGVDARAISDWEKGVSGTPRHKFFAKNVKKFCASFREISMVEGKLNPIVGIWWQKNYDGLRDSPETTVERDNPFAEMKDVTEISDKYAAYFKTSKRDRNDPPKLTSRGAKLGRPRKNDD